MMNTLSTTDMFQSVGLFSGSILPVAILLLFVVLVLPGLARPGAHPEHLSKAAYCYLAESLGIILMSAGGLPAVYAVFSREHLSTGTYMGLLLLFAIGGIVFLWHDSMLRSIATSSRAIPKALFFYSWKFIGLLVSIFATLSYLLQLVVSAGERPAGWWVVYVVMLTYGLIISWFTIVAPSEAALRLQESKALAAKVHTPVHTKKTAHKKAVQKGKKK